MECGGLAAAFEASTSATVANQVAGLTHRKRELDSRTPKNKGGDLIAA